MHLTAVQCSAVQFIAVQCSAVQCSAVQCSAVRCSAVQCSAVQCCAVQCGAVLYSAVQCGAALYIIGRLRLSTDRRVPLQLRRGLGGAKVCQLFILWEGEERKHKLSLAQKEGQVCRVFGTI